MKKQLRIGAYLRVSTDKQVQVFEGSLDTQKFRMKEFVKLKNFGEAKWGEIVDYYIEEGLSAGSDKRPQYQRLLNDICKGKIDLILVSDLTRLTRNMDDFCALNKLLERYNASFFSMKDQFDASTPQGKMMINLMVAMGQFEREQTSERVSINCNSRSLRGFVNGGRAGYGFERNIGTRGQLQINQKEAMEIREIFKHFKEQGSVSKALPVVEAIGIYPRQPGKLDGKTNELKRWNYNSLRNVLCNPAYAGLREVNKKNKDSDSEKLKPWQEYKVVKAAWDPIVDLNLYEEVQKILQENLKIERRRLSCAEARIFLLSGLLYCEECGRSLNGQSAHKGEKIHRYYFHAYKRGEEMSCSRKRIRADEIEEAVVNHLTEVAAKAGYFEDIEGKLRSSGTENPEQIDQEISKMKVLLKEVEKEISSTFRIHMNSEEGTEASKLAAGHLELLGNRKNILNKQLSDLEHTKIDSPDIDQMRRGIETTISDFRRGFKKASPAMKRRLTRRVFDKLVLKQNGMDAYFRVSEEFSSTHSEINKNEQCKVFDFNSKNSKLKSGLNDLSLSSERLLNSKIGWGSRT